MNFTIRLAGIPPEEYSTTWDGIAATLTVDGVTLDQDAIDSFTHSPEWDIFGKIALAINMSHKLDYMEPHRGSGTTRIGLTLEMEEGRVKKLIYRFWKPWEDEQEDGVDIEDDCEVWDFEYEVIQRWLEQRADEL